MSSRLGGPARRPVAIALCLMLGCVAVAVAWTASARAAEYKMVVCAASSGTPPYTTQTNTASAQHPNGIFDFGNSCGGAGGDPPGEAAFLRIAEHEASGSAGEGAYGRFVFESPWYVHFRSGGGYTREPNAFNEGWRARFWGLDFSGNGTAFLNQGAGLSNSGTNWATTSSFGSHLWPFGPYMDFHNFYFELLCVRPAGCDRTGYNATDANGLVFVLSDDSPSQVSLTNKAPSPAWGSTTKWANC